MRAIIIDDERYSVKAIKENIRWEQIEINGIEILEAYNVEQAKKIIEEVNIDFIICDIEMPRNNGISLIKWIREQGRAIETIIITCHEEFQYAREAISLNVYDYCVKPLDYLQMESILKSLVKRINEKKEKHEQYSLRKYYVENKYDIEAIFLKKILEGNFEGENNYKLRDEAIKFGFEDTNKTNLQMILVNVKQFNVHLASWNYNKLILAIRNISEKIFDYKNEGVCILIEQSDIIIISKEKEMEWLLEKCEDMKALCEEIMHVKICCYVGNSEGYEMLHNIFHKLKKVSYEDVSGKDCVLVRGIQRQEIKQVNLDVNLEIPMHFKELLEYAKYEEFISRFKSWMLSIKQDQFDLKSWQLIQEDMIQIIYAHIMKLNISARMLFEEDDLKQKYELIPHSMGNMILWMESVFIRINIILEEKRENGNSSVVDEMKKYMELHLTEELPREEIALAVHLNVDYAARIFKQEEGMSIMEYLGKQRIIKSISFMQIADMSISDIAYRSGFVNSSHYSTAFKKIMGISPKEYKNNIKK